MMNNSSVLINSTKSPFPMYMSCLINKPTSFIFIGFITAYTCLLLPLCILILHHGYRHWRKKRSTSSNAAMSHADCFTYNLVVIELVGVCGCIVSCYGSLMRDLWVLVYGTLLASFILQGEACFHVLTCVERYLAVVHPITYRNLKSDRAIAIRSVGISCVWLLCSAGVALLLIGDVFSIMDICLLICAVLTTAFCSISVLWILIRPGPGEQGGDRERVSQTKMKAFFTIVTILSVLVLRFALGLGRAVMFVSNSTSSCIIMTCSFWFYLPSSLVLPVLFLLRKGKSVCFKKT